jgi:hypothetical protein
MQSGVQFEKRGFATAGRIPLADLNHDLFLDQGLHDAHDGGHRQATLRASSVRENAAQFDDGIHDEARLICESARSCP